MDLKLATQSQQSNNKSKFMSTLKKKTNINVALEKDKIEKCNKTIAQKWKTELI